MLENNDQSIIMLTSERELRHNIVDNLVCPYLKLFADKKTKAFTETVAPSVLEKVEEPDENPQNLNPEVENEALQDLSDESVEDKSQVDSKSITTKNVDELPKTEISEQSFEENQKETPATLPEPPKYSVVEQPPFNENSMFNLEGFIVDDEEEKGGKTPKKRGAIIKIIISVILVAAVVLGAYFGYDRLFQPMQRASVYEEVRALYGQKWSQLPEDVFYKFGKLYQTNSVVFVG